MKRLTAEVAALVCTGALVACSGAGGDDNPGSADPSTGTAGSTGPAGSAGSAAPTTASDTAGPSPTRGSGPDAATDVDVAAYTTGTAVSWSLEGSGVECYINTASQDGSMGCTLDFTADVRDWQDPRGAAGAVGWVKGKGFQPAAQTGGGDITDYPTLHTGERISAAGVTCTATGDRAVTCGREGEEFSYDDGEFSSTSWDGPGPRNIVDGSRGRGQFCGRANNGLYADLAFTDVVVTGGTMDCAEAVGTVDTYLATWQDGSRGNALVTPLDNGWTCSFPTAKRSEDENTAVSCGTQDGRGVKIPVTHPTR